MGTATAYTPAGQLDDANTASASTGDVTGTRYYTFAGATVAVRTVTVTEAGRVVNLAFLFGDEQGSTSVMIPAQVGASGAVAPATLADASAATRTSYTPYGALRGADNAALDRGWLGQVEDRVDGATGTGLTYLNARYYDPATMRFISPDPLMNPADPKTLDPYRYADNNPVVFTDASGLAPQKGVYISDDDARRKAAPTIAKKTWAKVHADRIATAVSAAMHGGSAPGSAASKDPRNPDAFRGAVDIGFSTMSEWMASDEAASILKKGTTNSWTFNQVLAGGIGYTSSSWWNPKKYWHGASLALFLADGSGAGPDAIGAAGVLADMYPDQGAWDVKVTLGHRFGFDFTDPETDPNWGYLATEDGGDMYYDVIGNFQYGIMMSDFGVSEDVAISASHVSTAGNPDPEDDPVIGLGYDFRQAYPCGFTADDMYNFLMGADSLAVLEESGKYKPPSG